MGAKNTANPGRTSPIMTFTSMMLAATLLIIALAVYALVREFDVRLVLFAAGLALALIAAQPASLHIPNWQR